MHYSLIEYVWTIVGQDFLAILLLVNVIAVRSTVPLVISETQLAICVFSLSTARMFLASITMRIMKQKCAFPSVLL